MTDTQPADRAQASRETGSLFTLGAGVPDLFGYPFAPGFKKPGASAEAAAAIKPRAANLRQLTLEEIQRRPGTPDEIAKRLGKSVLSIRPRVSELIAQKLVRETDQRRTNESGSRAAVVEAAP